MVVQSPPSVHVFGDRTSGLPDDPAAAVAAIARVLADPAIEVLVFWDSARAPLPADTIARFAASRDDIWHASRAEGPDLLRYALPQWVYRNARAAAPAAANAIDWQLDFRASLVRADLIRTLGVDAGFDTVAAVALDLGLRAILGGAVPRRRAELAVGSPAHAEPPSLADRYRLLARHYGDRWLYYTATRRIMGGASPLAEVAACRAVLRNRPSPMPTPPGALRRTLDDVRIPDAPTVSVVLPTFGRYRYIAEVLGDLRAQTIRPTQIVIADGNEPADRQPAVYEQFADLPIEVLWHPEPGTCSGRNACLAHTTGDYVWFVDDDSRFDADNLEQHLRVLAGYGAEISVGPAYTKERPELHGNQREIVATFMDCGTTLVRRAVLEAVGGFDMQYNRWLIGEDGELGIRFVRAGALMVNNPLAKRFHYMAPVGGSRRPISTHRFDRWSTLPRPPQSIYYTSRRHYEPGTAWDAVIQACALYGWRRNDSVRATPAWRARTALAELVALPWTAVRLWKSVRLGRAMVAAGPRIPPIAPVSPA